MVEKQNRLEKFMHFCITLLIIYSIIRLYQSYHATFRQFLKRFLILLSFAGEIESIRFINH